MASIAVDNTSSSSVGNDTSLTYSHTCAGSDKILFVGVSLNTASDLVTGVTYGGIAMAQINTVTDGGERVYLYYIVNPTSGANNVVISLSSTAQIFSTSISYVNARQISIPDATNTGSSTGTSASISVTTVADRCFVVAFARVNNATISAGANTTFRVNLSDVCGMFDNTTAKAPPGSVTLNFNVTQSETFRICAASFAPSPTSGAIMASLLI